MPTLKYWDATAGAYVALAGVGPPYPNLPAPVTSGSSIQTYTDGVGDVWVAKNGVYGGAWRRAKDVLHSRVYLTATQNTGGTLVVITHDTATARDLYGLYTPSQFTAPVAGLYDCFFQCAMAPTASGQWIGSRLYINGAALHYDYAQASAVIQISAKNNDSVYLNAGDYVQHETNASTSLALLAGPGWTYATFAYRGTG